MLKSRLKFKSMNIFIIGPMGSGKSTVGKILSDELFLNFFDTDEQIELRTGATIDWIFDLEGEEGFRKRESDILDEMVQKNSIVLSTGGGIILSDNNRELLSSRGTVFFLSTPKVVAIFPLGSMSTKSTFLGKIPYSLFPFAREEARLTTVVVLAHPPL